MKSFFHFLASFRTILLVVLVLAALGGGGYLWWLSANANSGTSFRTEAVVRKNLDATITATGTIEPEEVIDVGAQVQGQILQFGKDPQDPSGATFSAEALGLAGSSPEQAAFLAASAVLAGSPQKEIDYCTEVKKGTVLAEIDPRIYQTHLDQTTSALATATAALASAQANLTKSQANRDALLDTYMRDKSSPGAIPQQQVVTDKGAYDVAVADAKVQEAAIAQAKAGVRQAQANLNEAQTNLDYCTITAPVDGVIVDRRVNVGQTVVASLSAPSLFLLAKDLTRLQIWVAVNEADIGNVHMGQDVTFTVDARPGKVYHGKVSQIRLNATMTQNVVTYTVVVSTTNRAMPTKTQTTVSTPTGPKNLQTEMELLPYLTANLTFHVDQRENALLVPNAALRWRPQPDQVAPEYRQEYEDSLHKKGTHAAAPDASAPAPAPATPPASGGKPEKPAKDPAAAGAAKKPTVDHEGGAQSHGTVWVEVGQYVRPIKLITGLTDGVMTEVVDVVKVHDGDALDEGTELVTGEKQGKGGASATTNPFAPPPIFRPQQPKKPADQ